MDQLQQRLVGGVNSPVRAFRHVGMAPRIAAGGQGALVRDVEGRSYIDLVCGWGSLLHGHAHPVVRDAVEKRLRDGWMFGLTTTEEGRLAERIAERMPGLEQIRFVGTGTESGMTAVRLARAATGRTRILKFIGHYHGHHDALLPKAGSSALFSTLAGVPSSWIQETVCIPFNDLPALEAACDASIAAVIVEPVATNMGTVGPTPGFLQELRRISRAQGALLIFDEVVTGFRLGRSGAQGWFGVEPDLTMLGKIVGGGFPAAAVGGPRHLMQQLAPEGQVFQAGTYAGHPIAMVAGAADLELASGPTFYADLEASVRRITDPVQQRLVGHPTARLERVGTLFSLHMGSPEAYSRLFRALLDRGILAPPSPYETWFVSSVHTPAQLDAVRDALLDYFS